MARFGALGKFDFDHFHLIGTGVSCKALRIKRAIVVAAAKVTRAYFPDEITSMLSVIAGNRAFTSIVIETTFTSARIERLDSVARKRTETHCRNIENTRQVGLAAAATAHPNPEVTVFDSPGK